MITSFLRESVYGLLHVFGGFLPDRAPRIFMYHSVGGSSPLTVRKEEFDWQMAYLAGRFRIVPLSRLFDMPWDEGKPLACVTFDDGFKDACDHAVPVLTTYAIPATFFVTAGYMGGDHPTFYGQERCMSRDDVARLSRAGHEIGGHTVTHPKLASLAPAAAESEIADSKRLLEAVTETPVLSFAYPKGSHTEAVKALVADAGFKLAVTVREGSCVADGDRFALPRIPVDATTGRMQFRGKCSRTLHAYGYLKRLVWV